jgi:hypothetical protein
MEFEFETIFKKPSQGLKNGRVIRICSPLGCQPTSCGGFDILNSTAL